MTTDQIIQDEKKYLFQNYGRYPIALVRGEGAYVFDAEGKKYLDFLSGIACSPLGHQHPALKTALLSQVDQIWHTSNLYYSPPVIALGKYLTENGGLDRVFFCNSGTEANEAAIKLARKYHWRQGNKHKTIILSAEHAFHGRTLGALAATPKITMQEGFGPMPADFKSLDWNDASTFCAAITENVAAVLLEPIQGEGGIYVVDLDFLRAVRAACDRVGALLIFDEVQCGIGRTGKIFAYQNWDVKPDIITLAKGIANGLPLGAVCARETVAAAFIPGDHGTTFGGNPLSCSVGLASLKVILEPGFLENIQIISTVFMDGLKQLQIDYPEHIAEVRGMGLMLGIEFNYPALSILEKCHAAGLLVNITADRVLRFLPPYILTINEVRTALSILNKVIQDQNIS